uniref:Uncharacterized protein n=1 Tax=Chromera velia CCMP2878 TaxID=1169474 RepID=A0A0G4HVT6_9ALVE|eukprot:Cvel_8928.t1-p1 / transcript=Cvel_8928.t1 / gene=Cvel_8928 / organism=Chromera_velia_CCMP2878 / gene_product=hypothetical protein / transcript_product=hypothetical protein / location=Cvel_scaffold502:67771-70497(+) / protein_length=359 / sequence_SO=supercontig / SO=protein_coding / is_pseudo=false
MGAGESRTADDRWSCELEEEDMVDNRGIQTRRHLGNQDRNMRGPRAFRSPLFRIPADRNKASNSRRGEGKKLDLRADATPGQIRGKADGVQRASMTLILPQEAFQQAREVDLSRQDPSSRSPSLRPSRLSIDSRSPTVEGGVSQRPAPQLRPADPPCSADRDNRRESMAAFPLSASAGSSRNSFMFGGSDKSILKTSFPERERAAGIRRTCSYSNFTDKQPPSTFVRGERKPTLLGLSFEHLEKLEQAAAMARLAPRRRGRKKLSAPPVQVSFNKEAVDMIGVHASLQAAAEARRGGPTTKEGVGTKPEEANGQADSREGHEGTDSRANKPKPRPTVKQTPLARASERTPAGRMTTWWE